MTKGIKNKIFFCKIISYQTDDWSTVVPSPQSNGTDGDGVVSISAQRAGWIYKSSNAIELAVFDELKFPSK
jgi:hypothetical protein